MASATDTFTYVNTVGDALGRAVAPFKKPCSVIERRIGRSGRAARNWLLRQNGPAGPELVDLMREFDEVFEAICILAGRTPPAHITDEQREAATAALRILTERR